MVRCTRNVAGLTRWQLAVFVGAVWALHLAWSEPWLARFRYGPLEGVWRSATYLKVQPFRRAATADRTTKGT